MLTPPQYFEENDEHLVLLKVQFRCCLLPLSEASTWRCGRRTTAWTLAPLVVS
jgi:hypothetical protein